MIDKLRIALNNAEKIVFFSGAGMSTASGIPDFRSDNGLYKNNLHAEEILSHSYYMHNRKEFFEFYKNKMIFPDALPNFGHRYIAELEKKKDVAVVTQNIDGLHQLAGSKKVYELHGSIQRNHCEKCHHFYDLNKIIESDEIPVCNCGGTIKPDVVLYEEQLDTDTINNVISAIADADVLVVLGTSLNVYPAASFIRFFKGKTLVIINKSTTPYDDSADIVIHNDINAVFRAL